MSPEDHLTELYPFLRGVPKEAAALDRALLNSIVAKATDSRTVNERFFSMHAGALVAAARGLADVYRRDGRLFTMGNGGSSCDAAHVAVEFLHPITAGRPALAAINLGADLAMLSAVSNDVGFDQVFQRQLVAQARRGDALIGVSTSGNSANLLVAFVKAKEMGIVTIGLTGGNGGQMAAPGFLDHCFTVPTDSVHRIQECHVATYHILWDLVHSILADTRGSAGVGGAS
jgi:D-sedoheptulose 7-phosphate isomerase